MNAWRKFQPSDLVFSRVTGKSGVIRLSVGGEIDVSTGDRFAAAISQAVLEPGARQVLLDLALLRFIDSNGVRVLVNAHYCADERGVRLGVVNAEDHVRSVLETLGVYALLAVTEPPA